MLDHEAGVQPHLPRNLREAPVGVGGRFAVYYHRAAVLPGDFHPPREHLVGCVPYVSVTAEMRSTDLAYGRRLPLGHGLPGRLHPLDEHALGLIQPERLRERYDQDGVRPDGDVDLD